MTNETHLHKNPKKIETHTAGGARVGTAKVGTLGAGATDPTEARFGRPRILEKFVVETMATLVI